MNAFGTLYVVSAPSGAGKTSLLRALVNADPMVSVSVSHTTRLPRPGEENGIHYHFVDNRTFQELLTRGAFLEHAKVFGCYYGTSRDSLLDSLRRGLDIILEIDWQGARQIRKAFPTCTSIFILPPSHDVLIQRLRARGQDDEIVITKRMREAVTESTHFDEFDYLVINDDFHGALSDLQAILRAQRLRSPQQAQRHQALISSLVGG
uniref:Guanylate kinase n=1 Tax=Candidatus Kentrum sp. MB TaxID=2138164 RepID=A0A450X5M1_9GAMM|nr:MAG: guanylate kinase [Candidatus Kentron sp. MB]VFK27106.1 MAG: guanylate kinase [Candidatus Kentron sp. MB]VFK74905.1 MAG: guanylate kinase [Candidatus Kentron sp. MB]